MMKINKLFVLTANIVLCSLLFTGCSLPFSKGEDKSKTEDNPSTNVSVEVQGGYSEDKSTYTLSSSEVVNSSNISISVPTDMTVLEDTDETENSYISIYNIKENHVASEDDYVLTYKIIDEDEIVYDKENTEKLYKNIYQDLVVSDIQEGNSGEFSYKYYTISYTSEDETLTDYVFEIKNNNGSVLAKMGTTFYPLKMDFETILSTILNNIND